MAAVMDLAGKAYGANALKLLGGGGVTADDAGAYQRWQVAVQAAAVLRVGAALWPAGEAWLTPLAAAAWAVAACGWALRYGGWLGRPRADGRPG